MSTTGNERLWEEIEKEAMTNEKAYAEIDKILAKWNMTEKELLLVLYVTLKQKEEKEKNDK